MLEIGDIIPDVSGFDEDCKEINLREFIGKKTVIYFYPKDNTPGCTKQACEYTKNYNFFLENNINLIGVSKDSVKKHNNFKGKYNLLFRLISDESLSINKAFDVWKEKSLYGKKYFGTDRTTFIFDEYGKLLILFLKVKPDKDFENIKKYFE
ncbi:MAG: peroxiredoxin [Oscillospiraceae bacterium]|nr:peroxiredoxin [Oscillospiraceae bacterium]